MSNNHVKAGISAVLMLCAILAVYSFSDGNIAKEGISSVIQPTLSANDVAEAETAGQEAYSNSQASQVLDTAAQKASVERETQETQAKAKKEFGGLLHPSTQYGPNCMTLKAYAIDEYDQLMDLEKGSINVLKDILSDLGSPENKDKYNTMDECTEHLDEVFKVKEVEMANSLEKPASIGADMLKTIIHEMRLNKGILIWGPLLNPSAEYFALGARERVYEAEDKHAKKTMNKANSGQWVFIDAERVGWSGTPAVFQQLAVRGQHVMKRAREMMGSTHHVNQDVIHITHVAVTPKQAKDMSEWSGNVLYEQVFPAA